MSEEIDLKAGIKSMIVERLFLKVSPEEIDDEASLMETYGIDSVALFELVVGLEEVYGVTLEDEEFNLDLFRNVNSIAELIERKGGAQN